MNPQDAKDLEIVPIPTLMNTVQQFCRTFAETPQFKAFEQANAFLQGDDEARAAARAYLSKYGSLRVSIMLKTVTDQDNLELQNLKAAYDQLPSVVAFADADLKLRAISQTIGAMLSLSIGMDLGKNCPPPGACC